MIVLGLDLAGPANVKDTALVRVVVDDHGRARFDGATRGIADTDVLSRARADGRDALVIGVDGPLSYEPGGGDRARDKLLRAKLKLFGMGSSVMPPTMTRMAQLTLRATSLSRAINLVTPRARVVEVHPGATCVLRGATPIDVRGWKRSRAARARTAQWLGQHIHGLPVDNLAQSDHLVAAAAAALAAYAWAMGDAVFFVGGEPPLHPFDMAA